MICPFQRKHIATKPKPAVEMGTQNKSDIDFDWIPKENLSSELSKCLDTILFGMHASTSRPCVPYINDLGLPRSLLE